MTARGQGGRRMLKVAGALLFAVAFVSIVWIIYDSIKGSETHVSQEEVKVAVTSLYCEAGATEGMFFNVKGAKSVGQTIKIALSDGKTQTIAYELEAVYNNREIANTYKSLINGDYNIYTGARGEYFRGVSSHFGLIENKVKADLYCEAEQINNVNGKVFELDVSSGYEFSEMTDEALKQAYENKGYKCEIKNY